MGEVKFAVLENPSTKTTKLYYVNDSIGGFTVSDIFEDKVVLNREGTKIEIKLRDKKDFKPPKRITPPPKKLPRRTPRRSITPRRSPASLKRPAERPPTPEH
jgi:type II secretory pathway component PulC